MMKVFRSEEVKELAAAVRDAGSGFARLAAAVETLERNLSDRMDVLEGRLDELKKQSGSDAPQDVIPGHKPWTQRRQERVMQHFNAAEFATKLQGSANGS